MRKLARAVTVSCALASTAGGAYAAEGADAAPAGPGLTEVLAASGVTAHGYVDAGYSYLSGAGTFTSGGNSRVFDTQHNDFDLHQAGLTLAYQPTEGFGGLLNVTVGHDAGFIHSNGGDTGNFDVTQGFVQYVSGNTTVMAGKFTTLAGAEVINSSANTNVSRSILFGYEPFTHTGVRLTYAADSTLSLIFGLNNGFDQLKDFNSQKTIEAGVAYTPSKAFSLTAQGYYGTEPSMTMGAPGGPVTLIDLVATFNVSDSVSWVLSYDYGSQDKALTLGKSFTSASWQGIAGYLNYAIDDNWRMSIRAEYFDDSDGYRTGVKQKLKEGTLTLAYLPSKAVEVRGELRADDSDKSSFAMMSGKPGSSQYSLALATVFKF